MPQPEFVSETSGNGSSVTDGYSQIGQKILPSTGLGSSNYQITQLGPQGSRPPQFPTQQIVPQQVAGGQQIPPLTGQLQQKLGSIPDQNVGISQSQITSKITAPGSTAVGAISPKLFQCICKTGGCFS